MMFAEIAFPTAVRRLFTYEIPPHFESTLSPGMRVWVPLQTKNAIGMVVKVHPNPPDFETKTIKQILDEAPVISPSLLQLTEWIHRYYYCSWGEAIQAALPSGLNFVSELRLQVNQAITGEPSFKAGKMMVEEIAHYPNGYPMKEAESRWGVSHKGVLEQLIERKWIEVFEQPTLKSTQATIQGYSWSSEKARERALHYLSTISSPLKWEKALTKLVSLSLPQSGKMLKKQAHVSTYALKKIEEEGYIHSVELPKSYNLFGHLEYHPQRIRRLNPHQQQAYYEISESIKHQKNDRFLLYGVTGSGKTEVYIHAIKDVLERGKSALVLVPEIALTPQTVRRFFEIFGDIIAVLHSRLSDSERFDAWNAIQRGDKTIVIGARSAVFAPLQRLGIIIMDEEHDHSYHQVDPSPRYHARETALTRASIEKAVVVLGSATPSAISLRRVNDGFMERLDLPGRHALAQLPEVRLIDLKQYRAAMKGPLTIPLFISIEEALARGEQAILLYNRRGYASWLLCTDCGSIQMCPYCSVSLTYHKRSHTFRCHYCGYAKHYPSNCSICSKRQLEFHGSGTQQVEDQLVELFPDYRIIRMDQDTTTGKNAHERILEQFRKREADILIGTQLVAKGLDFPNVTVVGVLNADTELAFPAYDSSERMYQLISQVAGRSGRGSKKGWVYIQTYKPEQEVFEYIRAHNHEGFLSIEIPKRKQLAYPPFSKLIRFEFKHKKEDSAKRASEHFAETLRNALLAEAVSGPAPAAIPKIMDTYSWEVLLKVQSTTKSTQIEFLLNDIFERYKQTLPSGLSTVKIATRVDI